MPRKGSFARLPASLRAMIRGMEAPRKKFDLLDLLPFAILAYGYMAFSVLFLGEDWTKLFVGLSGSAALIVLTLRWVNRRSNPRPPGVP